MDDVTMMELISEWKDFSFIRINIMKLKAKYSEK